MAGSWIKMRTNLSTDPRVVWIASATKKNISHVIGALHFLWSLADEHTESGVLVGYTTAVIDRMVGIKGFCQSLLDLKPSPWLSSTSVGLEIPEFSKHNGASAKTRLAGAQRAVAHREVDRNANVTEDAHEKRTKSAPREEKRREEDTLGVTALETPGFDRFWSAWPKHKRKEEKSACRRKWITQGCEKIADDVLIGLERWKSSNDWTKQGGEFISAPLVWLRKRRWEVSDSLQQTIPDGGLGFEMPPDQVLKTLQSEGLTP